MKNLIKLTLSALLLMGLANCGSKNEAQSHLEDLIGATQSELEDKISELTKKQARKHVTLTTDELKELNQKKANLKSLMYSKEFPAFVEKEFTTTANTKATVFASKEFVVRSNGKNTVRVILWTKSKDDKHVSFSSVEREEDGKYPVADIASNMKVEEKDITDFIATFEMEKADSNEDKAENTRRYDAVGSDYTRFLNTII